MARRTIPIDEAMTDEALLGGVLGDMATWSTWKAVLKAAFGIKLDDAERDMFRRVASRDAPGKRVRQLWALVGRRGGKSRMAALISAYLACCVDHSKYLVAGETGYVLCLAPTQRQAHAVLGYCRAMIEASPVLKGQIEGVNAEEIKLEGGVTIAVHPANFRTVRGRTLLGVVMDESALFRDEMSAQPDVEILRACIPGLITTGGMMIGISTPYGQRGLVFEKFRDFYGQDDPDTLVIKGASADFNPTLDEEQIAKELAADPEANASEYLAEFRSDWSAYIDRATLERCVDYDIRERPFEAKHRYTAFVDASSGRHDSFSVAIAHKDGECVVLDTTREWRSPFDPVSVVDQVAAILRTYRVNTIVADAYAAGFVESTFKQHSISYRAADKDKSAIFLECLPLFTSATAMLLDEPRLFTQLTLLQREVGKTGRDRIVKQRGGFDDLANAACGALVYARMRPTTSPSSGTQRTALLGHASKKRRLLADRSLAGVNEIIRSLQAPPDPGVGPDGFYTQRFELAACEQKEAAHFAQVQRDMAAAEARPRHRRWRR